MSFKGLTWVFAFLVIIPDPNGVPYMGFIFGLIFCILNSLQGVFVFICCHVLKKLRIKENKEIDFSTTPSSNRDTQLGNFSDLREMDEIEITNQITPD